MKIDHQTNIYVGIGLLWFELWRFKGHDFIINPGKTFLNMQMIVLAISISSILYGYFSWRMEIAMLFSTLHILWAHWTPYPLYFTIFNYYFPYSALFSQFFPTLPLLVHFAPFNSFKDPLSCPSTEMNEKSKQLTCIILVIKLNNYIVWHT